jgi:hypothetical protein
MRCSRASIGQEAVYVYAILHASAARLARGGPPVTWVLNAEIDVRSGQILTARRARPATLWVRQNALLRLNDGQPAAGDATISRVSTINWGVGNARIDVGDKGLVKDYANGTSDVTMLNDLRPRLVSGRAGGAWTGPGIQSSVAAANSRYAVGYATARQLFGAFPAMWSGQSIDDTTFIMRGTFGGDANLDGAVTFDDLLALAQNYGIAAGKHWVHGDFNYDGGINFDDLLSLAQNYGAGSPSLAGAANVDASYATDWALAQSLVPEPAWGFVCGAVMLSRRKRVALVSSDA